MIEKRPTASLAPNIPRVSATALTAYPVSPVAYLPLLHSLNIYLSMFQSVLYATKIGKPDWYEEIITDKKERIEQATAWALNNGFDRLRLAKINLSTAPDFTEAING